MPLKYEDYVRKRDGVGQALEDEITDSQQSSQERRETAATTPDFAIPDKFAGKPPEEIARSYVELEKKFSKQGNDLGELRRTVDQLIAQQSQPKEEEPAPPPKITADELYLDPQEAISRAARQSLSPELSNLEAKLARIEGALAEQTLAKKYPDLYELASDEEFQSWVKEKAYRRTLAVAAGHNDLEAASELLELYHDTVKKPKAADQSAERRRKALQDASLERGVSTGSNSGSGGDLISRAKVMEKKIAARQGDSNAERWLKANGQAILEAYKEGRVVD